MFCCAVLCAMQYYICDAMVYISLTYPSFFFRRAFHIMSYYLFFFNTFLGIVSCLMRIIKSVIIGVLFIERIQKSLLPRQYEKMDPGNTDLISSKTTGNPQAIREFRFVLYR